ncbi:uncharacterized protein EMH_0000780 [Eimeria mitis]|uniref:Uncharacterized protein n=1 Tax=Eimeria mitis TaxID=44415 RepID=U6KGH4_9EIME|nr:uncharacterized protein EMH_0000780 [Eimeria mitis]CDJ35866.1 hypothetical protein EMH_0000780 [Eimeria mitis]
MLGAPQMNSFGGPLSRSGGAPRCSPPEEQGTQGNQGNPGGPPGGPWGPRGPLVKAFVRRLDWRTGGPWGPLSSPRAGCVDEGPLCNRGGPQYYDADEGGPQGGAADALGAPAGGPLHSGAPGASGAPGGPHKDRFEWTEEEKETLKKRGALDFVIASDGMIRP